MRGLQKPRERGIYCRQIASAKKHTCYRHYTTVDALSHIFADQRFRLSCLMIMNDPIEHERIGDLEARTYFVASFSHELEESIPLWRLYGRDGNGICIEVDDLSFFQDINMYCGMPQDWRIEHVDIIDIFYIDAQEQIYENFDMFGEKITTAGCIGYIKAKAWSYEKETRILSRIHSDGYLERLIQGIVEDEASTPYIYCQIPFDQMFSIKIRFNPFMSESIKKMIKGGIASLCPGFPEDHFIDSDLQSKIRI